MAQNKNYTRREVIGTMGAVITSAAIVNLADEVFAEEPAQNREYRVQRYSFGWNYSQKKGRVNVWLENYNKSPVKIDVASPLEFAGYTTILKEEPVFLNTNGWLHTGMESVD